MTARYCCTLLLHEDPQRVASWSQRAADLDVRLPRSPAPAQPEGLNAQVVLKRDDASKQLVLIHCCPLLQAASHVRVSKGGIHHDTVQPGRDRGIAVNAGGNVGLLPEDVCVSSVPSGFFDHMDVDPP